MNQQWDVSYILLCLEHRHSEALCVCTLSELIKNLSFMYLDAKKKKKCTSFREFMQTPAIDGDLRTACSTHYSSCGISCTWSGNVVSLSSRSSSAYVKIVFRERRKNSSLKFWDVPTRDERDMVTCIFTLAKFCNREIIMVFQQPGNTSTVCCNTTALVMTPSSWQTPDPKKENTSFVKRVVTEKLLQ